MTPEEKLLNVSERLKSLAFCFLKTGNIILADKLNNLSRDVAESNEEIMNERAEELNERVQQAQQGTANMMNALFAGIEAQKEKDNG